MKTPKPSWFEEESMTTISKKAGQVTPLLPKLDDEPIYTPGEWRTNPCQALDGIGHAIEIEVDGQTIALVHPSDEMEGNARLIAAAPKLLVMVKYALSVAKIERTQLLQDGHQPEGMAVQGIELEIANYQALISKVEAP